MAYRAAMTALVNCSMVAVPPTVPRQVAAIAAQQRGRGAAAVPGVPGETHAPARRGGCTVQEDNSSHLRGEK